MPNTSVPAAAEGVSKFDKASIMRTAWAKYHEFRQRYGAWQIERGIVDASFSNCLKIAWRIAKAEAAQKVEATRALGLYGDRAADRVRDLTGELMRLDAQPWGMRSHRSADHRAQVQSKIATLQIATR